MEKASPGIWRRRARSPLEGVDPRGRMFVRPTALRGAGRRRLRALAIAL